MGCDIHFYVEKKVEGQWQTADRWTADKYDDGRLSVDYKEQLYGGRSYNLFAILADVRNGRGFAGAVTGGGFSPIAAPRGVPDDCCAEYRDIADLWKGGGHSHSHHTLKQLLDFDWTQVVTQQGWVNPKQWARWRDYGKPDGWCGGVDGGAVKHLSNEEFEAAWQKIRVANEYPERRYATAHMPEAATLMAEILGGSPYTLVSWQEPYYEAIGSEFFGKTIPRLLKLAADSGGSENVRVVFFFDN